MNKVVFRKRGGNHYSLFERMVSLKEKLRTTMEELSALTARDFEFEPWPIYIEHIVEEDVELIKWSMDLVEQLSLSNLCKTRWLLETAMNTHNRKKERYFLHWTIVNKLGKIVCGEWKPIAPDLFDDGVPSFVEDCVLLCYEYFDIVIGTLSDYALQFPYEGMEVDDDDDGCALVDYFEKVSAYLTMFVDWRKFLDVCGSVLRTEGEGSFCKRGIILARRGEFVVVRTSPTMFLQVREDDDEDRFSLMANELLVTLKEEEKADCTLRDEIKSRWDVAFWFRESTRNSMLIRFEILDQKKALNYFEVMDNLQAFVEQHPSVLKCTRNEILRFQ